MDMDAREIAALAEGLGRAMAEGFAANEAAKGERAEAMGAAQEWSKARDEVRAACDREQDSIVQDVREAVEDYCDAAREQALKSLRADPRAPRTINYLERYGALVGMDDRREVLARLRATLDVADRILAETDKVDVPAALAQSAQGYVRRVGALGQIAVCGPASLGEAGEAPGAGERAGAVGGGADVAAAIEGAFVGCLANLTQLEASCAEALVAGRARKELLDEQIGQAKGEALAAARGVRRERAARVAGERPAPVEPQPFDASAALRAARDPAPVRELSREVRASFATFERVVQDNGLFAAFATDGSYGTCAGGLRYSWWCDLFFDEFEGQRPGARRYEAIPCAVEEDEGGDTLAKSIERMRAFNKKKYWGMLDDDFKEHVEAFWYGFSKLMANVNALFEVDGSVFDAYCTQLSDAAQDRAEHLAARMDAHQAKQFCKDVAALQNDRAGE